MIKYVKDNQPQKVMMVTECSMSDNVQIDNPNVEFLLDLATYVLI